MNDAPFVPEYGVRCALEVGLPSLLIDEVEGVARDVDWDHDILYE